METESVLWVNGRIYTPHGVIDHGSMKVSSDGRIEAIGGADLQADAACSVRDLNGLMVLPGLIDVHIHGGNGFDVMEGTYESLNEISKFHARNGTTSLLATTTTSSKESIIRALQNIAYTKRQGTAGAELLGVHLEGPFISERRRGAQDKEHIRLPDLVELSEYLEAAEGNIRLVTLAPEVEGGLHAVQLLKDKGITVSIGHSDASFQQVVEAVQMGVTHTTHHFNGMSPLHHREPGVAGAGMILPALTTELIADGIHVHPSIVKLLFDTKTATNVCIITDAISCAGLPDGEYEHVNMFNGQVYLKDGSSLAGSSLTTFQALKNVMEFTGYSLEKVLPSMTVVSARQIRMDHRKGSLEPGKDADFLLVDDGFTLRSTYVRGNEVYRNF